MNSKILIGVSLALIAIVGTIAILALEENDDALIELSNKHDKDTKTMEELTAMSCEEILKENIMGLQYFTEEEGGKYIQEKVFECMKQQMPIVESHQLSKQELELDALRELSYLVKMTCEEIVYDTYNRIDGYETSDNRKFARDEVKQCVRNQDIMVREANCYAVFSLIDEQMEFFVEDTQRSLDQKMIKCQADPVEMELFEKYQECKASGDSVIFRNDGTCTILE